MSLAGLADGARPSGSTRGQPRAQRLGLQRRREQVALRAVDAALAQAGALALVLDALGDHLDAERARERGDGVHDGEVVAVLGQAGDEGAVELDRVDCPHLCATDAARQHHRASRVPAPVAPRLARRRRRIRVPVRQRG